MRLHDKVAVITGAAGGQGQAAVRLFAGEGARLVVADIDKDGAEKTAEEIRDAGGEAIALRTDVSREKDVTEMIRVAMNEFGALDVLFNNAGVGYSATDRLTMASAVDTPEEDRDSILAINLKSVAMGCKHAIPVMVENGGGAIVNNASINALVALSGADAYTAAKGGIMALTRVLAVGWGPRGVRVNCICPGGVDTPMITPVLEDEEVLGFMRESTPLGRLDRPEETARVALFLGRGILHERCHRAGRWRMDRVAGRRSTAKILFRSGDGGEDREDPHPVAARGPQAADRGDDGHPCRRVGRGPRKLPRLSVLPVLYEWELQGLYQHGSYRNRRDAEGDQETSSVTAVFCSSS